MSYSETGHAQNAAKFKIVITKVTAIGGIYNPSKVLIKLPAINTLSTNADAAILAVDNAYTPWSKKVGLREEAFSPLSQLVTNVINALQATDASAKTIKDAKALEKKIQGTRATPKAKPTIPPPLVPIIYISASQLQFDSRIENFIKLIILLTSEPEYIPNEIELAIAGLTAFLNTMKSTNTDVIAAEATLTQARKARNIVLYLPVTGLYDIQTAIKKYIRSISTQKELYNQLTKIKFSQLPKKLRPVA